MRLLSKRISAEDVLAIAKARSSALRQFPADALIALPAHTCETTQIAGRDVQLATYRDMLSDGRIQIVVQAYLYRYLGFGTMTSDGFIVNQDGSFAPIPEEVRWEFI